MVSRSAFFYLQLPFLLPAPQVINLAIEINSIAVPRILRSGMNKCRVSPSLQTCHKYSIINFCLIKYRAGLLAVGQEGSEQQDQ